MYAILRLTPASHHNLTAEGVLYIGHGRMIKAKEFNIGDR
jgi:hypothetical protein